nr:putative HGWP repeat containing protein [Oryza sativa Japonica Group]
MPPLLGVYVFTDRLAFAAADWCFRLHGWPLCRRCWASTSSPTGLPSPPPTGVSACTAGLYAAVVGRLRLHRPAASSAADWCFRLHGWPIMPPLLGVYVFTDRPPRPPPTGASACTAGLLCRRCWASTSSPTGLPSPPPTGVFACTAGLYAAVVGRLRLHRPACLRRRRLVFPPARLAFMSPLLGVYVFTDRPPRSPPTGASACTAGLYAAVVGRLRLHRPACLRRRRLVFPPARLAFMSPLLGIYVFTDRPPRSPPTGASVCTAGLYAAVVGRLRLHRPACLRRGRLVFPPARLTFMPPLLGVYVFTDRLAFAAADWCFRLHGWPIMPPLLGVYVFTDRPPRPPPTGASACTAGLLCRRCWASMSSPTGLPSPPPTGVFACTAGLYAAVVGRLRLHRPACLRRRRLVLPPARLAYYAAVVGRLRLHRPAASSAADWCFRLHGWPIMLPLLGVHVFTDRPPRPPPTGASACTAGLYAAVVGRLRLHRPAASTAADWCFRLHGWPLCRRCWASTSSSTGRLVRRRLVSPPTRLAYYAAVVGHLHLHRRSSRLLLTSALTSTSGYTATTTDGHHRLPSPTGYAAADWCFYLHNCASSLPVCFCCRRLVFTSSRQYNFVIMVERLHLYYLRYQQTLLLLLHKFYYFTNHDVFVNLDISACNAMLFYYNKWLSNIQDFYLDIFNTYLQSSNDYSTTRSYNSRLYVQLFPN